MTATYTWDVFATLDGYGSYAEAADWGGYWSKQGPELLEHRAALFDTEQRMVYGATNFRETAQIMSVGIDRHTLDEWNVRTRRMPATVVSSTLQDTLGWPDATIVSGEAVDIVAGRTGTSPILAGAGDFDLELLEHRTRDRHIHELVYRPTLHG